MMGRTFEPTRTPDRTGTGTAGPGNGSRAGDADAAGRDDFRRMAPTYAAVIIVETLVLLGLWWFQQHFTR